MNTKRNITITNSINSIVQLGEIINRLDNVYSQDLVLELKAIWEEYQELLDKYKEKV